MDDLFDMRRDFTLKALDESDLLSDPIELFRLWLNDAISVKAMEPNAMNLATANKEGRPSSRTVLLKQVRSEGFVFFTNYESKKAKQIEENKYCALNFVWHELERQVRVEGVVEKVQAKESDLYFEMRPAKSKLGAWASPQSKVIPDRNYLEKLVIDFSSKFKGVEIPRPKNWGGYILKPYLIEFWQGRPSRLHDRIQYLQTENGWKTERLAP